LSKKGEAEVSVNRSRGNKRRLSHAQLLQRRGASEKSAAKRQTAKILSLIDELKRGVIDLEKYNVPPIRFPVMTSSSVIDVDNPRSNEGDEDPAINRFLDTLDIDLQVKLKTIAGLMRGGGGKM